MDPRAHVDNHSSKQTFLLGGDWMQNIVLFVDIWWKRRMTSEKDEAESW